jgi:hypothetical protein
VSKKPLQEQFNFEDGVAFSRVVRLFWKPNEASGHQPTHWIDFEILEAAGRGGTEDDSPLLYYASDERSMCAMTTDIEKAVPDCSGFVKWDGCTQIYFPDEPALHYDDISGLVGMFAAIARAQARCYEIMRVT